MRRRRSETVRSCFRAATGAPLSEKRLRRLLQQQGVAAVPHGFRSTFRDWAAEETELSARGDRGGAGPCREGTRSRRRTPEIGPVRASGGC